MAQRVRADSGGANPQSSNSSGSDWSNTKCSAVCVVGARVRFYAGGSLCSLLEGDHQGRGHRGHDRGVRWGGGLGSDEAACLRSGAKEGQPETQDCPARSRSWLPLVAASAQRVRARICPKMVSLTRISPGIATASIRAAMFNAPPYISPSSAITNSPRCSPSATVCPGRLLAGRRRTHCEGTAPIEPPSRHWRTQRGRRRPRTSLRDQNWPRPSRGRAFENSRRRRVHRPRHETKGPCSRQCLRTILLRDSECGLESCVQHATRAFRQEGAATSVAAHLSCPTSPAAPSCCSHPSSSSRP